jgi:hypothetical protein
VGEFQGNRSSELRHFQNAYLFNIFFFFSRIAWRTHNLLKQKNNNTMRGAITNQIGAQEVPNLPILHLKKVGDSPSVKEEEKQYD